MAPVRSSIEDRSLPFRELQSVHAKARLSSVVVAAVLFGDDVVDGMQSPGHCLGYEAVFAAFARTFANQAAQGGGDVGRAPDRSPLRLTLDGPGLGQTDKVLDVLVPFPFPLLLGREAPGAVLREQFLDAVLQVRGGSQAEDFFRRWQTSQRLEELAKASIARRGREPLPQPKFEDLRQPILYGAEPSRQFIRNG